METQKDKKTDLPEIDPKKTGYEGTGEEDPRGQVENDNDIKLPQSKKIEPETTTEKEEKKEEIKENKDSSELSDYEKALLEGDEDLAFAKDKKQDADKNEEPDDKAKDKDEDDVFQYTPEEDTEAEKDLEKPQSVDWILKAKKIGFEIKSNDPEEFDLGLITHIEAQKQKVEPDVSKYAPEAQELIKLIENGLSMADILNPVKEYNDALAMPDDEKVENYLVYVDKVPQDKVKETISDLYDEGKFKDKLTQVNNVLTQLRENKFKEILTAHQQRFEARAQAIKLQAQNERNEMVKVLNDMTDFMGLPLPVSVKDALKKEIQTGQLTKKNDNATTQIKARLFDLFGTKALAKLSGQLKEANREGFNKGKATELEKLHNEPIQIIDAAGHVKISKKDIENSHPLAAFRDIEKDAKDAYS
jgi:hypothetical protein